MGILRNAFGLGEIVHSSEVVDGVLAAFAVDEGSIDPAVFGLTTYAASAPRAPRMDRATAMQVPAVKRSRDLVCTSSGGLRLRLKRAQDGAYGAWSLFDQPERDTPRSVTMTRLFEDMFFEGVAWWDVTEFGWHTYPSFVRRLAPGRVAVTDGRVYVDGRERRDAAHTLIRFDSPNDALLSAGARAIRTCLMLDQAAANMADGVPPADFFTPGEGMDPATTDAEIVDMLDKWQASRRARSTGYVPAALEYHAGGWSPEQLQLADARQHAVLEIARVAGVDPEELGVSTTSRTYSSDWSRRKGFLDFTLGGYLNAVSDRLRMTDVTPNGYEPEIDLDGFLRSDPLARYTAYKAGIEAGALDPAEVRQAEGKPELKAPPAAPVDPAVQGALDLAKAAPSLAQAPGLPALVEQLRALMAGSKAPELPEAPPAGPAIVREINPPAREESA